jgi:hypothetical protein
MGSPSSSSNAAVLGRQRFRFSSQKTCQGGILRKRLELSEILASSGYLFAAETHGRCGYCGNALILSSQRLTTVSSRTSSLGFALRATFSAKKHTSSGELISISILIPSACHSSYTPPRTFGTTTGAGVPSCVKRASTSTATRTFFSDRLGIVGVPASRQLR